MLNKLTEQIRECLGHAEECARKAAAQSNVSLKEDFLNLEKNWRSLAQSIQLSDRLTDFANKTKRTASAPIIPFRSGQEFDPETVEAMGQAFVATCESLGLSDRNGAMAKLVAEKIIELAQRGIKKSTELHFVAMNDFRSDPQQMNFCCDDVQGRVGIAGDKKGASS
ncbi:MAG TPA: hypothetical protein VGY54_00075 [Polyangiaceae bacterium]|jgi:hypothetical protein|nr:hypothetical protein [Polyangiaceae bacterium]